MMYFLDFNAGDYSVRDVCLRLVVSTAIVTATGAWYWNSRKCRNEFVVTNPRAAEMIEECKSFNEAISKIAWTVYFNRYGRCGGASRASENEDWGDHPPDAQLYLDVLFEQLRERIAELRDDDILTTADKRVVKDANMKYTQDAMRKIVAAYNFWAYTGWYRDYLVVVMAVGLTLVVAKYM